MSALLCQKAGRSWSPSAQISNLTQLSPQTHPCNTQPSVPLENEAASPPDIHCLPSQAALGHLDPALPSHQAVPFLQCLSMDGQTRCMVGEEQGWGGVHMRLTEPCPSSSDYGLETKALSITCTHGTGTHPHMHTHTYAHVHRGVLQGSVTDEDSRRAGCPQDRKSSYRRSYLVICWPPMSVPIENQQMKHLSGVSLVNGPQLSPRTLISLEASRGLAPRCALSEP